MSTLKNTIANIAGAIIPLIFSILTVPLYLKLIGEERYGILAVIWVLLGYFGVFDLGLGKATTQRMASIESESERSELLWTVLALTIVLGVLGGLVLLFSSDWMLTHLFSLEGDSRREALDSTSWLPVGLILLLLNSAMKGSLQARERFVEINSASVLGDSMAQLLPLIAAWFGYVTIDLLLPAVLAARLLTAVLLFVQCYRHVPLSKSLRIKMTHVKPLLTYGGWASMVTMSGPLMTVIERTVIASIAGAKGVTFFTVPFNLVSKLSILPNSYGGVLFPKLASLPEQDSKVLAEQAVRNIVALMTPLVIFGMGVLHPFLILWLGSDLAARCAGIGELILLGVWVSAVIVPHSYKLYAEGLLKKKILIVTMTEIPLYALMLWLGVRYFGILGAAAAWSLRVLIDAILFLILAKALREVVWFSLSSIFLVAMATIVVLSFDVLVVWRWFAITALIALSVAINWQLCVGAYKSLTARFSAG
ncbi:MAG: oligosaccharide flippase family protein [Gallionella sp.]|nr:oligosaccharide flippase family protein [Gallionella sp.]MDD4946157.1 oligosaccharide flippase family protein [Gallionella sp.]